MRNEAGFGLLDYHARYYSPVLGRFVSADTIVPEPGKAPAFDRYAYVENNPLRYTDPTGYCRYDEDGNFVYAEDCSLEEYKKLSWVDRIKWMQQFAEKHDVPFDNVIGILRYFSEDPVFSGSEWASISDAGVLLAIQDGYREFESNAEPIGSENLTAEEREMWQQAVDEWSRFFRAEENNRPNADDIWGTAEQKGVDFGLYIARDTRDRANTREQFRIHTFVLWGNIYRGWVSSPAPSIKYVTEPSNSSDFVYAWSRYVISSHADALRVYSAPTIIP